MKTTRRSKVKKSKKHLLMGKEVDINRIFQKQGNWCQELKSELVG
jgi:hypothetical protein